MVDHFKLLLVRKGMNISFQGILYTSINNSCFYEKECCISTASTHRFDKFYNKCPYVTLLFLQLIKRGRKFHNNTISVNIIIMAQPTESIFIHLCTYIHNIHTEPRNYYSWSNNISVQ